MLPGTGILDELLVVEIELIIFDSFPKAWKYMLLHREPSTFDDEKLVDIFQHTESAEKTAATTKDKNENNQKIEKTKGRKNYSHGGHCRGRRGEFNCNSENRYGLINAGLEATATIEETKATATIAEETMATMMLAMMVQAMVE